MNRRKRGRVEGSVQTEIGGSNKPRRPQKWPRREVVERGDDEKAHQPTIAPTASTTSRESSLVSVSDLPAGCTVLELKSRFEMFGSVSRVKIDQNLGFGYITFRARDSAELAISTSRNTLYPIFIRNKRVQVSWANDPLPQWKVGVSLSLKKMDQHPSYCEQKCLSADMVRPFEGLEKKTSALTKNQIPFTKGVKLLPMMIFSDVTLHFFLGACLICI